MRINRRFNPLALVLFIFFLIGFVNQLILHPINIILPIIVFGAILYFVRHPEKLMNSNRNNNPYQSSNRQKKNRDVHFRVINFRKDDDDSPRYH